MIRLYDRFLDLLAYAAAALLAAVMVGIGVDVAARYFFGAPIGWVFEFVQHSMLLMLCLGMAWLAREGGHVSIEIVLDASSPRIRKKLAVAAMFLAGLVSGFVGFWACLATLDNFRRGVQTTGIYPIPRFLLIGAIALGLALTCVEFVRRGIRLWQGRVCANESAPEHTVEP